MLDILAVSVKDFFTPVALTYKLMMIVSDNSRIVSKWSFKLIDDARVIIYEHNMFIIQATDVNGLEIFFVANVKA
jgi:hypothetical protein